MSKGRAFLLLLVGWAMTPPRASAMHGRPRALLRLAVVPLTIVFCTVTANAQGVVLPLPPADQQEIAAKLGPSVVGAARPSEAILDASAYFPLQPKTLPFQVTAGKYAGNIQELGLKSALRPGGSPAWRFRLSPSLAGFITVAPSGDLIMPAISDFDEGVVVVSTPATPFVTKGMKPGDSVKLSQAVSVNYLDNPSKQDHSGNLTTTQTYVGMYQVTVPAGTFDAVLLRLHYDGKIGPASVKYRSWYFFARNVGVIAMITHEEVSAAWIYHTDATTGKVLAGR
ncbi:MAG TPA: hypothetical protein VIG37_23095 [Methylomirabilota bacterium]|jgi:hypothetical protein